MEDQSTYTRKNVDFLMIGKTLDEQAKALRALVESAGAAFDERNPESAAADIKADSLAYAAKLFYVSTERFARNVKEFVRMKRAGAEAEAENVNRLNGDTAKIVIRFLTERAKETGLEQNVSDGLAHIIRDELKRNPSDYYAQKTGVSITPSFNGTLVFLPVGKPERKAGAGEYIADRKVGYGTESPQVGTSDAFNARFGWARTETKE